MTVSLLQVHGNNIVFTLKIRLCLYRLDPRSAKV